MADDLSSAPVFPWKLRIRRPFLRPISLLRKSSPLPAPLWPRIKPLFPLCSLLPFAVEGTLPVQNTYKPGQVRHLPPGVPRLTKPTDPLLEINEVIYLHTHLSLGIAFHFSLSNDYCY